MAINKRALVNIGRGVKARVGVKKMSVYFLNDIGAHKQKDALIRRGWLR